MLGQEQLYIDSGVQRLDDDLAFAWSGIEIDEYDLLPGSEGQLAIDERHRQCRADQRCPHMGVSIVVVPGLLVNVGPILGCEFLKGRLQIVIRQTGFELGGGDPCSRTHDEDMDQPLPHRTLLNLSLIHI